MKLLLLALACKKTPPPPPPVALPEAIDPWSEEALQGYVDEIVPLVEKHAGRRFRTPPPLEVLDDETFRSFIVEESRLIASAVYNDTPEEVRERYAQQSAQSSIRGLFGKFGIFTGKTYIVPSSIEMAADQGELESAVPLAKIVIAHEITHALQAQLVDTETQLPSLIDNDHMHGWSAVSEGGANFVAIRVARDLGLENEFWLLSGFQGWGEEGLSDPSAYDVWMRYGHGMHMLETVVESGGMDAFWAWHEAPPVSSSMLFRPETYAAELNGRDTHLEDALRGTDQRLTRGDWMASNTRLGEYTLRGEAIRTGKEEQFDPILAHLVDAQVLELTMTDRDGDIRVLEFDAPEHALEYLALLRAEQTVEGQIVAKFYNVTVEVTYQEVKGVEGDASLLRTQRVPMGGGRFNESRTAWVVRGRHVVAVTAERFRPGLRLANTLNAVFDNLDSDAAHQP